MSPLIVESKNKASSSVSSKGLPAGGKDNGGAGSPFGRKGEGIGVDGLEIGEGVVVVVVVEFIFYVIYYCIAFNGIKFLITKLFFFKGNKQI